jgi:hypothetical protein
MSSRSVGHTAMLVPNSMGTTALVADGACPMHRRAPECRSHFQSFQTR